MSSFSYFVGQRIKKYRKSRGYTIEQFSTMINKSKATLSKYENGEVNIAIDSLVEICTALNVDISELLPATFIDLKNADILKYEKHLIDRLYIYWYNGELNKVKSAMIENSHPSMKSKIYFTTDAADSEYQSDFIYHGTVSYSDTSITFYYTNEAPPFDKVFIRMPLLFQKGRRQTGIMSCISLYYQGVTVKILVSHEPLTVTDEIRDEMLMTPEEIKELKRTNMLIIK